MFKKVLIANRGEIATRIIDVLKEMGISSVAVCSEAELQAVHTLAADEFVCVGGPLSQASYLNAEAILEAAKKTGADAIHPGYGFLSENAGFSEACAQAGITFIGPPPEVIRNMGDKQSARSIARSLGVPVVPGSAALVDNDDAALGVAEEIGFPVLVKAAGGGGGIGMEVAREPGRLAKAIKKCQKRAERAFGDGRVYLEKYIEAPHHIEVQVFFDTHGKGVHLFERECSIQRRHQKVVEEAQSPFVGEDDTLRQSLIDAAMKLASGIAYVGAGTVEFVVGADRVPYFIEMNTRLQVEHPVTELITQKNLIKAQLEVAQGLPLPFSQDSIVPNGHAIEFRIYAEDPEKGFLPSPGTIETLVWPKGENIRVDSGIKEGSEVTPYYDPMLAKLIVSGDSRSQAIEFAKDALLQTQIEGIKTNLVFHRWLCEQPKFIEGHTSTKFIDTHYRPEE